MKYGDLVAVDHIDLQIEKGRCSGSCPNGAGRAPPCTCTGYFSLTAGRLEVLGMDITARAKEVKALIGVAPQENNLDPTSPSSVTSPPTRYSSLRPRPRSVRWSSGMMQLTEKRTPRSNSCPAA